LIAFNRTVLWYRRLPLRHSIMTENALSPSDVSQNEAEGRIGWSWCH